MSTERIKLLSEAIDVPFMDCNNISKLINEYSHIPYIYQSNNIPINFEIRCLISENSDFDIKRFIVYKLSDNHILIHSDFMDCKEDSYVLENNKLKVWDTKQDILNDVEEKDYNSHILIKNKSTSKSIDCKCKNCRNKGWRELDKEKCLYQDVYRVHKIKKVDKIELEQQFEFWFKDIYNLVVLSPEKVWNIVCKYNTNIIYKLRDEDDYQEIELTKSQIEIINKKISNYVLKFMNECKPK